MGAPPNWFIAWPIDAMALAPSLREGLPAGLRRVAEADLHITLAFLGAVGAEHADRAWRRALTLPCPVFRVEPLRLAALGNPRRPSAYGMVLDDDAGRLTAFIGEHRDALRAAAGVEPESRPALPHLTLARPPRSAGPAIRQRASAWLERTDIPAITLQLDRFVLYTRAPDQRASRFLRVAERVSPEAE